MLTRHLRAVDVRDITLERGVVHLAAQMDALPVYRPDSELLQAVRDALAAHPYLTADDRRVVVDDRALETAVGRALDAAGMFRHGRLYVRAALGEVTLEGYISTAGPAPDIVKAAAGPRGRSVVGAMEVAPAAPASKSGPVTAAASATES